jgi:hypothetical protein
MSKYYVFKGTTGTALMVTDDKTGVKLPKHPVGDWVLDRELDLKPGESRIGFSADEIIAAVTKDGYLRWPAKD